ncbi:predicted protein [Lichtheimia corymbifera JMRC:FSU:9682]|uniref:Uncharacterized protein n=1 Tax=Lichtheimia corymbifera JMRC:FSU:9682 TaxID=1263082 RepID=A0A068S2H9_9FUNG|nr:predicted protein [Lichtheimia corymbifera JMRC:FSU:9682]
MCTISIQSRAILSLTKWCHGKIYIHASTYRIISHHSSITFRSFHYPRAGIADAYHHVYLSNIGVFVWIGSPFQVL